MIETIRCHTCRADTPVGIAVFFDCHNLPTERPTCQDCYERSIRDNRKAVPVAVVRLRARPAEFVDNSFHGEHYWG